MKKLTNIQLEQMKKMWDDMDIETQSKHLKMIHAILGHQGVARWITDLGIDFASWRNNWDLINIERGTYNAKN